MNCENCGIPQGTKTDEGRKITFVRQAENKFKRAAKTTVWVCGDECAVQTLAIAKYGPVTRHWPITLAKFRSTRPLEAL
jgi:hypothetical protein